MALTDNLVSFWELEEASGVRSDSHGTNHLTDNNTVTQAVGKVGNAAQFTVANSESLTRANNAGLHTGAVDFSFAGWFWLDSGGAPRAIVSKYGSAVIANDYAEYILFYDNANQLLTWRTYGNDAIVNYDAPASLFGVVPTGQWVFFYCERGNPGALTRISVNNGAFDSVASQEAPDAASISVFSIGSIQSTAPAFFWGGRVDQIGFWKRLLTVEERTWLYNSGNGRTYAEVVQGLGQEVYMNTGIPNVDSSGGRLKVSLLNAISVSTGIPGVFADGAGNLCVTDAPVGDGLPTGYSNVRANSNGRLRITTAPVGALKPTGIPNVDSDGNGSIYVESTTTDPTDVPTGIPGLQASVGRRLRVVIS